MKFNAYGENAFTFLLFSELKNSPQKLCTLLSELKLFQRNQKISAAYVPESEEPIIWLFPNFGKRGGFGEPDAMVLLGKNVFWFEVETYPELTRSGRGKFIGSLIQLFRFYCFANAVHKGAKRVKKSLVITGETITDDQEQKSGKLRLKGHEALYKIKARVEESIKEKCDHYVLLSDGKPTGIKKSGYDTLQAITGKLNKEYPWFNPPLDRFYYAYWRGDLDKKLGINPFESNGYTPIKGR